MKPIIELSSFDLVIIGVDELISSCQYGGSGLLFDGGGGNFGIVLRSTVDITVTKLPPAYSALLLAPAKGR